MTKNQILARLVERNSNFRRFALAHGYEPRMVSQTVNRYAGSDKQPRGILTYKILRDLSALIGEPVIEGLVELSSALNEVSPLNSASGDIGGDNLNMCRHS